MATPSDLEADLHAGVRKATGLVPSNLTDCIVELAKADTADDQAWGLTRLAAAFRRAGFPDDALRLLAEARELGPSDHPERAIYTCAVSAYCDRGDLTQAAKTGEEQLGRSVDLKLFSAMVRVYYELFDQTGDPARGAKWQEMSELIDSESAEGSPVAISE